MVKRVLFIGNSPNRLVKDSGIPVSWDGLMGELEEHLDTDWKSAEELRYPLPLSVRAARLQNWAKTAVEQNKKMGTAWQEWYKKVAAMEPSSFVHEMIGAYHHVFDAILTTNYDYTLEKCMELSYTPQCSDGGDEIAANLTRRHGKVWHIHGEVAVPDSMVMERQSYLEAVNSLRSCSARSEAPETWLSLFLQSEVYVCGFHPGCEELLFWHALAKRMELPPAERKPVIVYLFCDGERELQECEVLKALLLSYDVRTVGVQVPCEDKETAYEKAWRTVLGYCLSEISHSERNAKSATELPLSAAPFAPQRSAQRRRGCGYGVKAATVTLQNPFRCWMNIRVDRLQEAVKAQEVYLFECCINGQDYHYSYPAAALEKVFQEKGVAIMKNYPRRYSFYLDYRTGCIYATVSMNDKQCVISLNRL